MNLRQFDLNLLLALDALLKEKNVTRAAERLFMSQPAMSGMLARLRQAFDDELLVRVGRNFELTEFAAAIAGRVHQCVVDLEELVDSKPHFSPAAETRAFSIAASDYAALLLFGPLMQRLSEAAPNVSVHFVRLDVDAGERIAACEIDFGILPAELELPLPSVPLFEDTWDGRAPLGWDVKDAEPAARAVVALCSDWFPATTAEIVHVDGGVHAMGQ